MMRPASPLRRSCLQTLSMVSVATLWPLYTWAAPSKNQKDKLQSHAWKAFEAQFIQKDGRVVSDDGARNQTYSEGQAYALFFALISEDRSAFERILAWTENNLCQGDIASHLPAWLWGQREDQQWGVLDPNSASDADVWIAYTLMEAGRLWNQRAYTAIGKALSQRILDKECVVIPGLGLSLLPGSVGFVSDGRYKLNASYSPLQVLQALGSIDPAWLSVAQSSMKVITGSSPRGICADWIWFDGQRFSQDPQGEAQGRDGYNAIRVYLWAGLLNVQAPLRTQLIKQLAPMAHQVQEAGIPPEFIDPWTLQTQGEGPPGFSAALLPFLQASNDTQVLHQQMQRLQKYPVPPTSYYQQCLDFFSAAWLRGSYSFGPQGQLRLGGEG